MDYENLLNELYNLTIEESERSLTDEEIKRYVEITDILYANDVEIPFGIEL